MAIVLSLGVLLGLAWFTSDRKLPKWLDKILSPTPQKTVPADERKKAAMGGTGLGAIAGLGLIGMVGISGDGRSGASAETYVKALRHLAQERPGSESETTAEFINSILAATAVSFGVAAFGTPANAARTQRRAALTAVTQALEADGDLRERVTELLGNPEQNEADAIVQEALFGPDGAPTLAESRDGRMTDKTLTIVGLRSDLWTVLLEAGQNALLAELSGPISTTGVARAVIVTEDEETAASVLWAATRLGRTDIAVSVAPGLYSQTDATLRFNVGALERAASQVVRLDSASSIEVIASPSEPDLGGLSEGSALRVAAVRIIDASLRIVEEGSLIEIGLAAKAAALIARQA